LINGIFVIVLAVMLANVFVSIVQSFALKEISASGDDSNKSKLTQEDIKRRLNSGKVCYHSVQNRLSSQLLSKNLKIRIYKTIMLLVFLYGGETWSLTLKEEQRLGVFENRVLRRIFGPKRDEENGENCIMKSFTICTLCQVLLE
jgi:hypothetical protein